MPLYEYVCEGCSTVYEERRSFAAADDPSACPACESPQVHRMLSTFIPLGAGSDGASLSLGGGCACSTGGSCGCQ